MHAEVHGKLPDVSTLAMMQQTVVHIAIEGVCGCVQARYSPINFDYFAYSALRWGEHHRRKADVLAAVARQCQSSVA